VITAIDTSVLLDVFGADPTFGPRSREAVERSIAEGSLVACDVVWTEVSAYFPSPEEAASAMDRLGIHFSAMEREAALSAGSAWKAYRIRGGPRTRVVPDLLIGAHALSQADRLLTRDARFHRSYFQTLQVLDPTDS
jgi:predicted nucleic acid-binding protein